MIKTAIQAFVKKHGYGAFAPKAVLFDMDGVLFDSMPLHARSWSDVCTAYGVEMSPEEAYLHEGRTAEGTINILMQRYHGRNATAEEIRHIYDLKCRAFNACEEAPKMPGADAVLQAVKASGMKMLIVTGSGQLSLLNRIAQNFPGMFLPENIVSSKDVKHGKPSPEPYLLGLEKAGVAPWEAVIVENAPLGVRSGTAAGIFTIAVNTGPIADRVLLDEGANLLFPDMQSLSEAWDDILASR